MLYLAATARLYGVDEGDIFNDEVEMDGAISDTDANDVLVDDDVAVTGMKCMCSECTMAIPSAKKGGQRKESMKRPAGADLNPKGNLKLVKRLGKGGKPPSGYLMLGKTYWCGASGKDYHEKLLKVQELYAEGKINDHAEATAFLQSLDA